MRAYVGSIIHETNAFSPIATTASSYTYGNIGYEDLLDAAAAAGCEVIPGVSARAAPSAPTVKADYEGLRESLVADIGRQDQLDLVLLALHGAQVAEGYPDCESDIVARVRARVGENGVIAVLLDLHASIGAALLREADLVVVIKEYPHTDFPESAAQLVDLAMRTKAGEIRPVTAFVPLPVYSLWHTPELPSRALVERARAMERNAKALHVSLVHGFPWSDVESAGAAVLTITDGDREQAAGVAAGFARDLWSIRDSDLGHYCSLTDSVGRAATAESGPVVIADAGDNPGAGSGSDSTWLIHGVLERKLQGVAIALLWDPLSLERILAAGVGGQLELSLGAHSGSLAGEPVQALFEVVAIKHQAEIDAMPGYPPIPVEALAAVRVAGVTVVVGNHREQVFGPRVFTEVGLAPAQQRVLIVKSAQHFYKAFAPLASEIIYCDTPCSRSVEFAALPFKHRRRPIWPLEACTESDIPAPRLFAAREFQDVDH